MRANNDYILGNKALHERFLLCTAVLGALLSSAPQALSVKQLAAVTGRAQGSVGRACSALKRGGMLHHESGIDLRWILACEPCHVTLADVFQCAFQSCRHTPIEELGEGGTIKMMRDVDLLIMQATVAINQSLYYHLRQFSLDRLEICNAGLKIVASSLIDAANLNGQPCVSKGQPRRKLSNPECLLD